MAGVLLQTAFERSNQELGAPRARYGEWESIENFLGNEIMIFELVTEVNSIECRTAARVSPFPKWDEPVQVRSITLPPGPRVHAWYAPEGHRV